MSLKPFALIHPVSVDKQSRDFCGMHPPFHGQMQKEIKIIAKYLRAETLGSSDRSGV
jgi:hypothetical protein